MIVLAIDTALENCSVAISDGSQTRHCEQAIGRGHAEVLMPAVAAMLREAGRSAGELDRIVVTTGPGSFTGLRVGVATARGLALALKIPAIGVTTLEALAEEARQTFPGRPVLAVLDGGRGEIHAALYDEFAGLRYGPAAMTLEEASAMASASAAGTVLAGTAAVALAEAAGRASDIGPTGATADIAVYARSAAGKTPGEKPRPLYLRDADAKPQAGFVLPRAGG